MDVILAQLGRQELEAHCSDAMKTQLAAMQRALSDAVAAAKRAEEVQLASQKLAITLFEDGSGALVVAACLYAAAGRPGAVARAAYGSGLGVSICATPTKGATPSRPSTSNTPQKTDSTPRRNASLLARRRPAPRRSQRVCLL